MNAAHIAALSRPEPFVSRYEPWNDPEWYPYEGIGILGLGIHAFF